MTEYRGHRVLLVPVPALESFVSGRWAHYDPGLVSRDPAFTHAHITLLAPFLDAPTDADLAEVAAIADATPAFAFHLAAVTAFADGVIHLPPEPAAPFARLTALLHEAFPQCLPYGGRYDDVVPHLTLDLGSTEVTVATTQAALGDTIPVRCVADRVELHWYGTGACHVRRSWPLRPALR